MAPEDSGYGLPDEWVRQSAVDVRPAKPAAVSKQEPARQLLPYPEVKPYFDMAKQYVLADEMFASDFDTSSFESQHHQYLIAGSEQNNLFEYPDGGWAVRAVALTRSDPW